MGSVHLVDEYRRFAVGDHSLGDVVRLEFGVLGMIFEAHGFGDECDRTCAAVECLDYRRCVSNEGHPRECF